MCTVVVRPRTIGAPRPVDGAEAPTPKGRFIDEGEVPYEFELVQQAIDIFIQYI